MKYFIYQGNDHDCAFAALKIYLATLARDKSYLYIPKPSKREHYNLDDIAHISENYGVSLECYTCTSESYDYLEVPCITLIDENHTVMVKKKNKRYVVLYDPGRGIVKMKRDEFIRRWRNVLLFTEWPDNIKKIDKIRQHLLPPKLELFSALISLLSAGLLIASFYTLNRIENVFYSLIFLGLFIGFQITEKTLLYKQVYTFDNEYIPRYFDSKKNCSKEKYAQYNDYKRQFFTQHRHILADVLLAFTITFLLCFNDFRNIFVLIALVLIKILESILFSKKEQETRNYIAEIENSEFKTPTSSTELALKANMKADNHVFFSSIKEIVYIFGSFAFALGMMFLTNNSGCNFVIFHFVMYYAGFNAYNQLIEGLSKRKETQMMERRFFDSCNL